jgi:hypothetical protein
MNTYNPLTVELLCEYMNSKMPHFLRMFEENDNYAQTVRTWSSKNIQALPHQYAVRELMTYLVGSVYRPEHPCQEHVDFVGLLYWFCKRVGWTMDTLTKRCEKWWETYDFEFGGSSLGIDMSKENMAWSMLNLSGTFTGVRRRCPVISFLYSTEPHTALSKKSFAIGSYIVHSCVQDNNEKFFTFFARLIYKLKIKKCLSCTCWPDEIIVMIISKL